MKVGVVGPSEEDDFAWHIARGLRRLGCEVTEFGPALGSTWAGSRRIGALRHIAFRDERIAQIGTRSIAGRIQESNVELVITVESLPPGLVRQIAKMGVPSVLWFPDAVANLGPLWMFKASYAALFFKEPFLVRTLTDTYGYNAHYLPECCDPLVHRPIETAAIPSVAVVGNMYATRINLLCRLHSEGIPLTLYGGSSSEHLAGTPIEHLHTKRYLRGAEKATVFRNSIAVLNNLHPAEIEGVNARLFEATGSGGIVVTEFRAELPRLFSLDNEVLAFRNYAELVGLLKLLTSGEMDASGIANAGSARSHAEHTYAQRLEVLLEIAWDSKVFRQR